MTFRQAAAPWCLLLCTIVGCSGGPTVVPVKGTLTRAGQPLKKLTVYFYPEDNSRPSTSRTDDEGRFELNYDDKQKGAHLGKHKVVVAFLPTNPLEEVEIAAGRFK